MSMIVPFSDDNPKNPANAASIWDSAEPENPKLYPHPVQECRVMRAPYTKENLPPEDTRPILARTQDPMVSEMQEFHRRMQREEDGAVAREAYAKLSGEASAFLFGNQESGGGLLNSKGKDALESVSRMRDWFGKTTDQSGE